MLTFFRRIRKGLLDMGAARKYLLYAVGEILLVMIGILLALQVNNWNEIRKVRKFEVKALIDLRNEFKSNHESFLISSEKMNHRLDSLETYIRSLANKDLAMSQKNKGRPPLGFSTWKPESDVLNSLFSTGKIETIRNDSLKYYLTKWNGTIEEKLGTLDGFMRRVEKVQDFERSKIPRPLTIGHGVSENIFYSEEEMEKFRESIIGNIEYQNTIISCANMLRISLRGFNYVVEMNTTILSLLEKELLEKGIKPE